MRPEARSRDGLIIDQRQTLDEPFGARTSDQNGCGWIALYNFFCLIGRPLPEKEIQSALLSRSLFRGRLGTSPFAVNRFLVSYGVAVRRSLGKKRTVRACLSARAGILLYRHSLGLHYVAFSKTDGGALRFFNAISGDENHVDDMASFLAAHNRALTVYCWTLPDVEHAAALV